MSLWQQLQAAEGPLELWFNILAAVNLASFLFAIWDVRARWMALSVVVLSLLVIALHARFGYTRILGLGHIVVWLPLFAYLWKTRRDFPHRRWTNRFIALFLLVNGISFALDSVDVLRYLAGDSTSYGA